MKKILSSAVLALYVSSLIFTNCYADDSPINLTLDAAINSALGNSILLKQVKKQAEISDIQDSNTINLRDDLINGETLYNSSKTTISNANTQLLTSQASINQARDNINIGLAPEAIKLSDTITIPAQADITTFFTTTLKTQIIDSVNAQIDQQQTQLDAQKSTLDQPTIDAMQAQIDQARSLINSGIAPDDIPLTSSITISSGSNILNFLSNQADNLISQIKLEVEKNQSDLDIQQIVLNTNKDTFNIGTVDIGVARKAAEGKITSKLNITDVSKLDTQSVGEILIDMTNAAKEITSYGNQIYKNQVALLVKKSYFDALKAKKICESKSKGVDRAKTQYDFAELGYETGLKSKDEMLQARMYYTATNLDYKKAVSEYNNSLIELKKNMGMGLRVKINLVDVSVDIIKDEDVDIGIAGGVSRRFEVCQATRELELYNRLKDKIGTFYGTNSDRYNEASLLSENAQIKLDKARQDAESSIRESYETMNCTKEMLSFTKQLLDDAQENFEIAKLKHDEGFGSGNSLLKSLNIEEASGTILEVIAAEENLTQVEQKIAEIENGYSLARAKYLDDTVQDNY